MNTLTTETPTMKSSELHSIIYQSTGKYKDKGNFHKKIRQVLENVSSSILEAPIYLPNQKEYIL